MKTRREQGTLGSPTRPKAGQGRFRRRRWRYTMTLMTQSGLVATRLKHPSIRSTSQFPNLQSGALGSQRWRGAPPIIHNLQLHLKRSPYLLLSLPCRQSFLPLTWATTVTPFSLARSRCTISITKKVFRVRSSRRRISRSACTISVYRGAASVSAGSAPSTGVMRVKRPAAIISSELSQRPTALLTSMAGRTAASIVGEARALSSRSGTLTRPSILTATNGLEARKILTGHSNSVSFFFHGFDTACSELI